MAFEVIFLSFSLKISIFQGIFSHTKPYFPLLLQ